MKVDGSWTAVISGTHPLSRGQVVPRPLPADLQSIVEAWMKLPDAIKQGILADGSGVEIDKA
jgi:hypothetical protein